MEANKDNKVVRDKISGSIGVMPKGLVRTDKDEQVDYKSWAKQPFWSS